jgi:hypothetical protein
MPDYKNGKIYTIRCRDDELLVYVGSTTQQISQRWQDHKSDCSNINGKKYDRLLYKTMRETGQDQFYIELYEDHPCERKEQLEKREGEIMREINSTLNKRIPSGKTKQEYNNGYYMERRETKNKNRTVKIECCCGCMVRRDYLQKHQKSNKHQQLMTSN